MSDLTFSSWSLPTAELGEPSPLPPIRRRPIPVIGRSGETLPADLAERFSYGHVSSMLPYAMQQAYSRNRGPQAHPVAVLENRSLRAVFLLDYGGRLWSLLHKPSQTELLAQSSAITFCNLGLRNAWFRGGVEWNVGTIGHSPLTCSPMYAARLQDAHGNPVLRLYEWERLRQVVVQIDVYLPDESAVLLVRPRIINPGEQSIPMYWWSNIAVPQTPGMRVLVPADAVYVMGQAGEGLRRRPVPCSSGVDLTFPSNWPQAADLFFDLRPEGLPWIGAVSSEGVGIFHASQEKMPGRKLWVWGDSRAGRNWQEFLAPNEKPYVEIQAGLTRTQLEHFPLAAGEARSWVEAYGRLEMDPALALGDEWGAACAHAAHQIRQQLSSPSLSAADGILGELADTAPEAVIHRGAGWGALERRRRELGGHPDLRTPGVVFDPAALGDDQRPWITLLASGTFPAAPPELAPRAFVAGADWERLLERSLEPHGEGPWNAWLHLGIMRRFSGDDAGAEAAWERSLAECWTPWAARNLAVMKWERGQLQLAVALMLEACRAVPDQIELLVECGSLLIEAGRPGDWLDLLAELATPIHAHGRIRLLQAQAAAATGQLAVVAEFFQNRIVPDDLREGETSLADLWAAYQELQLRSERPSAQGVELGPQDRQTGPIPVDLEYVIR
ncbi:MAG: DUF5107 domain-containing protein [Anaerolineales bacterium]|nr:DUF5107 domain-containing protein [Anaerolineales bacterium]